MVFILNHNNFEFIWLWELMKNIYVLNVIKLISPCTYCN